MTARRHYSTACATSSTPCQPAAKTHLQVRCFCRNRATAIAERVEELFRETLASFSSQQANRYLLQNQTAVSPLLELKPGHVSHSSLKDLPIDRTFGRRAARLQRFCTWIAAPWR